MTCNLGFYSLMVMRDCLNKVHTAFGPTPYSDHTLYMHIMAGMNTVGVTTFNVIILCIIQKRKVHPI